MFICIVVIFEKLMTNLYLSIKFYKILLRDFVRRPMGIGSRGQRGNGATAPLDTW